MKLNDHLTPEKFPKYRDFLLKDFVAREKAFRYQRDSFVNRLKKADNITTEQLKVAYDSALLHDHAKAELEGAELALGMIQNTIADR